MYLLKIKKTLTNYYKFFAVVTGIVSLFTWYVETKVVRPIENQIEEFQVYKERLIYLHEFWILKGYLVQLEIDQYRAYSRLGKVLGETPALTKIDDEIGRTLIANILKHDAMMAGFNISSIASDISGEDSIVGEIKDAFKESFRKYNEYNSALNRLSVDISDIKNPDSVSNLKIDSLKIVNLKFKDEFQNCANLMMAKGEELDDKLKSKKAAYIRKTENYSKIILILFIVSCALTVTGSYLEAHGHKADEEKKQERK